MFYIFYEQTQEYKSSVSLYILWLWKMSFSWYFQNFCWVLVCSKDSINIEWINVWREKIIEQPTYIILWKSLSISRKLLNIWHIFYQSSQRPKQWWLCFLSSFYLITLALNLLLKNILLNHSLSCLEISKPRNS